MIPPMNHSNYRLPVLPANGRAGSRLKSFVMTCSLIFAAAGFCLAATNCSNGNKTSDTPPALSFETTSKTLEVGETYRPTLRIRHDGDANDTAYDMDGNPLGVTFRSSSPQTVSVNARGIVTGRNVGTATVTAETASGDARCAIGITVRSSNTTWIDAPLSDGIIFSRFVQLPANTVMQGFDVDSRGEIFYTQVTDRYKILVSRSMPDRQATEYMTLCFHGHSSNMAVEEAGDERFVWVGNYANRVDDGNYWHEQVVSRIRYNPGSTHYPWNSDENYFIEAGCLNMNPAVDAANDQLAILYTRVDTPGRYCWVVYSLSEAKALPEETVTLQPLSYGGKTESYPLRKDVTPEVRVRNLSRLQPLARFSIPTPAIAWQGYEIHDGRMYLMEGTSGNNDGTTGEAYMTVYDFEGRIVQSRTKVRAVSDLKALTEAGITESGYIESEGVKIRRGKLFLGFASQSKKDGNRRRANIFQYELP